jgi:hypothetical protein
MCDASSLLSVDLPELRLRGVGGDSDCLGDVGDLGRSLLLSLRDQRDLVRLLRLSGQQVGGDLVPLLLVEPGLFRGLFPLLSPLLARRAAGHQRGDNGGDRR